MADEIFVGTGAKYLGVVLGPGAPALQWESVVPRMVSCASEIGRTGRGLTGKLQMFCVYVLSLL